MVVVRDDVDIESSLVKMVVESFDLANVKEKCEIIDWDLDRIYLDSLESGREFTVRMWDIRQVDEFVCVRYSLFVTEEGNSHGDELVSSKEFCFNK